MILINCAMPLKFKLNLLFYIHLYICIIPHSCLGMVIEMQLEAGYITLNTQGAYRFTRKRKDKSGTI